MTKTGTLLNDSLGSPRWEVLGLQQTLHTYSLFRVKDRHPLLDRELYLMTLNYDHLPGKNLAMEVADLRHAFDSMIRILCGNFTFLPEPVDQIVFTRTESRLPDEFQDKDPGLIFSLPAGFQLSRHTALQSDRTWHNISRMVKNVLATLNVLHRRQIVMQALPLHTIVMSHTTFQPYFIGMDSLILMTDFKGFNPNKAALRPDSQFCAPECYDANGYLSPATDIYALGKLVLQVILSEQRYQKLFPSTEPFPFDFQNRVNALNLPPSWARMLCLCLHPAPKERFQDGWEVIQYLKNPDQERSRISHKETLKPARPASAQRPAPGPKQPWSYRPNNRLPAAAMIICADYLTNHDEQLDFMKIYYEFMLKFNLTPRVFFQRRGKATNMDENPFFLMLKSKFKLEPVIYPTDNVVEQTELLFNHLNPENLSSLIVVSSSKNRPVINLFQHPKAAGWRIFWIRKGMDQAPVPIEQIIDAELFIVKRK
jgi:serine/threonine protein kinase